MSVASLVTSATPIRLWNSGTCPYAQRAWIALLEKKVNFEHKIVDLQDKPADFVELYASINPDLSARAKVPILEHGDAKLIESSICAEYVAEAMADQGNPLLPSDPLKRAKVRLLRDMWDQGMGQRTFPLLRAETPEAIEAELTKFKDSMKVINDFLERHGEPEGPFFCGPCFSLAEVHIAPFVQRMVVVLPRMANIDPLALAQDLGLARLKAWMEGMLSRPSCVASNVDPDITVQSYTRLLSAMKGQAPRT